MPPSAPEPLAFTVVPQGSEPRLAVESEPQNVDGVHPAASTPEPNDLEPIVIRDDGPSPAALAYLAAQGIGADTAAAFRIDAVGDADLARLLTPRQRAHLTASGLWLPTCDPRQPATITGLIRLTPAQHLHRHIGMPAGIAADPGLADALRVVLVDNPLLGLRLHERGVAGIAIVEDPAALVPLADWLVGRAVVTITTAKQGDLPLPPGIVPVGTGRITGQLERAPVAVLALLGLDPAALRQPITPLPLDPRIPQHLHAYAERMLATTAGQAALAALDLDRPEILAAYRPGFLPADYRLALTDDQRRMLHGRDLGGCIVLPAFDAQGAVVDLVAMQVCAGGHVRPTLWETPRGVCAPVLATSCETVVITTVARWLGRLGREVGPTVLIRDAAQAAPEAARLAAGGVRSAEVRCHRTTESEAIAAALSAAGITVRVVTDEALRRPDARPPRQTAPATDAESISAPEPDAPAASTLVLVRHDAQAETAIFRSGEATYTVQIPWGTTTSALVVLTVGTATHRDRFDLAVAPQRLRFASAAGLRTKLPPADIATALTLILPAVQRLAAPAPVPVATAPSVAGMSDAERDAALALLRDPAVVPRLLADLDALGWVGEPEAMTTVLLAALSRLSDEPVWAALTAAGGGERFPALGVLAAITPPEHLLHISRLTDNALFHGGPEALRHKLLILDDLAGIGTASATALRVLHARGVLTGTTVERDPIRGGMRTKIREAQGPLAVVTATTGSIPAALQHQLVEVAMDESPAQVERLLAARSRPGSDRTAIIARWINAQRLLRPLPVSVPSDLAVPVAISRHHALHGPFFGLVAASALLHQHQRPVLDGRLCATAADVELASRAVLPLAGQFVDGYGQRAQTALVALRSLGTATFTMADAARVLPDWSLGTVRRALEDLIAAEGVVALRRRNGVRAEYRVVADLVTLSGPFQAGWKAPSPQVVNG